MDSSRDLDRLDRVTLRTWRAVNIVGWWLVGAAIYIVGGSLLSRMIVQRIAYTTVGWQALGAQLLSLGFIATTAGWMVGRHVYRWPGIVGAAAVFLPWGPRVLVFSFRHLSSVVDLVWLGVFALPITLAAIASRIAWQRRPSAMRAPLSRRR